MQYAQSEPKAMKMAPMVLAKTLGQELGSYNLAALWGLLQTAPGSFRKKAALAGFDKEDITLELKENCLYLRVEKKEESTDENKKYLMKEIAHRSFSRCIQFPTEINTEEIISEFKDGVLKCSFGKIESDKPETVKIKIE